MVICSEKVDGCSRVQSHSSPSGGAGRADSTELPRRWFSSPLRLEEIEPGQFVLHEINSGPMKARRCLRPCADWA